MRALAISIASALLRLSVAKPLANAQLPGFDEHRGAERDIRQRKPAVPKEVRLVNPLTAGLQAGDDLAKLGMKRGFRELARFDVRAQAAERSRLALSPVVDDDLVHDVGQRQLDRTHRAIGDDQRTALDPRRLEERCRSLEPRSFDDDVSATHAALPVLRRD